MPNGMKLGNHPGFSEALNKWARAEGGDVLYEGGAGGGKSVDARIVEIETVMKTDYNKYQNDKAMVTEYGELLAKRQARQK